MGMTARYGMKMRALAALVLLAYPTPAAAECSADGTGCEDGGGNCIMPLVTCSANADCLGEQWCGSECPGGGDHCREPNCISRHSIAHSCEGSASSDDPPTAFILGGFFLVWNTFMWCGIVQQIAKQIANGQQCSGQDKCQMIFPVLFLIPFFGVGLVIPAAVGGPVAMGIAYIPIVLSLVLLLYRIPDNPITQLFVPCFDPQPPLHRAAFKGDLETCRTLLDAGKEDLTAVNKAGATALHSAFFFFNGLDDWQTNVSSDKKVAAAIAKFQIAQLLMDRGASTQAKDPLGKTPIDCAPDAFACARAGLLEPMKMMLTLKQANATDITPNGTTLLHAAALCSPGKWAESRKLAPKAVDGKCDCARYLLSLGLNPDMPNQAGATARSLCTVNQALGAQYLNTPHGPGPVYEKMQSIFGAAPIVPSQVAMAPQAPTAAQMMMVTVPNGVASGQNFVIQTPSGQQMQVTVPPGVTSGQTMQVSVPAPTPVTAAVVVEAVPMAPTVIPGSAV